MDAIFERPRQSLVRLFHAYLDKLAKMKNRAPQPFGTYYEFGTGWGGTLASFMLAAERICNERKLSANDFRVFAFDSFEGLPESDHPADRHGGWGAGAFANAAEIIQQKMDTHPFAKQVEITYVKGYFKDTLTDALALKLEQFPPSVVTVDVDFYTSTKDVLYWINNFIASGALIYFDDIWAFHGHPQYGQIRAIREFLFEGNGNLVPFDTFGEAGKCFIYSRRDFEYR
jgi:O-methyltransferase